jgi:hypothetical protein
LLGKKSALRSSPDLTQHFFTDAVNPLVISDGDRLFAYVWLDPKDPPKSVMLQWNDGTWDHRAYWGADKCLLEGKPNGPDHFFAGALPATGEWARLEVAAADVGLKPQSVVGGMAFTQFGGSVYFDNAGVRTSRVWNLAYRFSQLAWELKEEGNRNLPEAIRDALAVPRPKRTAAQKKTLSDHYLRKVHEATLEVFAPLEEDVKQIAKDIKEIEDAIPSTLITEEMASPRPAYVLLRGDFLHRGEKVHRGVPDVFPPLPAGAPDNRLGLANWLVRPDHPLTARVAVNRFWAQMFGQGIVRTLGDFGSQGDYPSHPELLDWFATEFVRTGWDVKAILRTIALSKTYQQSSLVTGSAPRVDPTNRLLHRAPRHRLGAEELRDSALAIAGILNDRIGGPSFMPYQPADFYKGRNEEWPWKASDGAEQYRRGVYAFWRRNALHPMFALLDAPPREECTVSRPITNTPLQALVTLNDPTFVEAARVFAQKIMVQETEHEARLRYAFRRATCRTPSEAELAVLRSRYRRQLERFRGDDDAASKLVNIGQYPRDATLDVAEHAAWTAVANMLLNLDEVLTRE